ncbi:MAG: NrfD/PsrC family molybdoenzyme membrane anchor subunit [Acidobacteriota bacterium]
MENSRAFAVKAVLWFVAGLGAAVALLRFSLGLGTATALSDTTPWGLWIGFDVMGGVALAAGGFVMAALVHVFHREKYHDAARPAILTAFLGYGAVAVGLVFDLGLPWHIWHPVIFWNIRSPLFEVAWCVMLYLTVLSLEVAPVILVKTPFQRAYRFLTRLALPIMILGIMLSTLHQSSLGTMLLIMPFRVHPLWYTPLLPEVFFVSAICLGLTMVLFEHLTTAWVYRREPNGPMVEGLARLASFALAFYLLLRFGDLYRQGKLGLAFDGSFMGNLFLLEIFLSALVPMAAFALPAVRRSTNAVWAFALSSVLGFVLNRINASGLSQVWATKTFYFPAWMEFAISLSIVAACALVFFFIEEHFPVNPHHLEQAEAERRAASLRTPTFAPFTQVWLGLGWRKAARVYSLLFVLAMAIGLTVAPKGEPARDPVVQRARGGEVLRLGAGPRYVYFNHKKHAESVKESGGCGVCHHLHKPGDQGTPCSECHSRRYEATRIFDHDRHVASLKGAAGCARCHGEGAEKSLNPRKPCEECHKKDMVASTEVVKSFRSLEAPGYRKALHGMCIPCHREKAKDPTLDKPDLFRCGACHNEGTESERAYRALFPEAGEKAGRS